MRISTKAIDWINSHGDLIDEGIVDNILKVCPAGIMHQVIWAIVESGIKLTESATDTVKWGIKSFDGYLTVRLDKHDGTTYHVDFAKSESLQGGMQIGFKSIVECIDFMESFDNDKYDFRPSRMQPKVVDSYTWEQVDTHLGKCWVTNLALDAYDPRKRDRTRKIKKLQCEIYSKQCDVFDAQVDMLAIREAVSSIVGEKAELIKTMFHRYKMIPVLYLFLYGGRANQQQVQAILDAITKITSYPSKLINISVKKDKLYIYIDVPGLKQIEDKIYADNGI